MSSCDSNTDDSGCSELLLTAYNSFQSFSGYFIWSVAQKLSLHIISFHRREGQSICSFSDENIALSARDLHSLLSRIILKIYYGKHSCRDNPGCCLFEIRMRRQVLKNPIFFSMSFITWENGKKHLELSVNSKVQPENSPVGSLHPLSVFICCPFPAASYNISFWTAVILCFIGC